MTLEKPVIKPTDRQFKILFGDACTAIQADYYCGIINTSPHILGNAENDNLWKALGGVTITTSSDEAAIGCEFKPLIDSIAREFRLHRLNDVHRHLLSLIVKKSEQVAERNYTPESIIYPLKQVIPHAHLEEEYLREFVETYSFLTPNTLKLIKVGTMPAAHRYLIDIMYNLAEARHFLQPRVASLDATAMEFDRYLNTLFTLTRSNLMRQRESDHRTSPLDCTESWNTLSSYIIAYAVAITPKQFANLMLTLSNYDELEIIKLFRKCLGAETKEEFRNLASYTAEKIFDLLNKHNITGRDFLADPWRRLLSEQPGYPTYFTGIPSDCFVKPTNMFN